MPNSTSLAVVEKALEKVKIQLMGRPDTAFFTTVCFSLKHIFDPTVPTACTDGTTIRFGIAFFASLSPAEQLFLVLHEVLHVCFLHMVRRGSRDADRWNRSADLVINDHLITHGYVMPAGGLYDPQYTGMSTEQIYDLLPVIPPPDGFTPDLVEPPDGIETTEASLQDILIRAAIQSKLQEDKAGSLPGEIQVYLDKLLRPKLPWRQILSRYVTAFNPSDYSFARPNRRFFPQHLLPSVRSETLMDIAVAVDVSGSVSDLEFTQALSEVHRILRRLKPDKVTLIQFDNGIRHENTIRSRTDLRALTFTGRGGTRIEPVYTWADTHKPALLLVFSDGDFRPTRQTLETPTVWLVHNNPTFTAPFGKVIHYTV